MCEDKIAATIPKANNALFMKYQNGLIHDRDIGVGGGCMGIDYCDKKLFKIVDEEKSLRS